MALPPILPAPKKGTTGAQKTQQQQQSSAGAYRGPANPKPVYVPPPSLSPQQTGGGTDIQSSGANYGSGQANRYKQTPAYKQAVISTFQAQPPRQQQAILQGAMRHNTLEGQLILQHVKGGGIWDLKNLGGSLSEKATSRPGGLPAAVSLPLALLAPGSQAQTGAALFKNAAKDTVNLIPNTVQGGYKLGSDIVGGHIGNAFHDLVDPYVHFFQHPTSDFMAHPVNTGLLFAGPEAVAGRVAGATARSGALGEAAARAADTTRAPLRLGGDVAGAPSPIIEHRSYSPNVLHKAAQVAWEKHLQARGLDPNIARPGPRALPTWFKQSMNIGVEAKLRRVGDEMTAVRQMQGRENRGQAIHTVRQAAPHKAVRNIVSHVLQGVVRSPETAHTDILAEINRLKAQQTGNRTAREFQNRAQVRDLSIALKHPELWHEAFGTAKALREFFNSRDAYMVRMGLLHPDQAMRSKLFPYAQAHMGATYSHEHGALVNPDHPNGIPTDAILQHLKTNGVPDPAYVGHFPNKGSFWNFYQSYRAARGSLSGHKRTGEAFRTGNYNHSYEGLVAQAARVEEAATKASLHDRIINRLGIARPDGRMFTPSEARKYALAAQLDDHGNVIPGAPKLVPITAAPGHALELVKDLQHPSELHHNIADIETRKLDAAMNDAAGRNDGIRNVVLVPEEAMNRFKDQFARTGGRALGRVTQQFRRTVLPYSTHWMVQNVTEAGLRGLVGGVIDPRNIVAGRQLMRELKGSEQGRLALQEMVNATFFNKRSPLDIHNPNENLAVGLAKRAPVSKQIIAAHNRYADAIGGAMYGLEHEFRVMGLGKLARKQLQEFTKRYQGGVRLQAENLAMLADKLKTDPALVARFGREVDALFGQYNKFTPKVRAMVQSAAPFIPWYLNAAKFVLWNLPAKHPVASSLLASLRQTINQDVQDGKQMPLNAFARDALATMTPFGIFNLPDNQDVGSVGAAAFGQVGSMFLPQFQGAFYNMAGTNSFGEGPLKGPNGAVKPRSGQALASAGENLLEGMVPLARMARLAREGGVPSYGTSTLINPQPKPEGSASAEQVLARIFNPFYSFERSKGYSPTTPGSSSGGLRFNSSSKGKGFGAGGGGFGGGRGGGFGGGGKGFK